MFADVCWMCKDFNKYCSSHVNEHEEKTNLVFHSDEQTAPHNDWGELEHKMDDTDTERCAWLQTKNQKKREWMES